MSTAQRIQLPDGSIVNLPGGGGGEPYQKIADIMVEETVNQLEQNIGFKAKEFIIFWYAPKYDAETGMSSIKVWNDSKSNIFQDNGFGDTTKDKYYRIEIKDITKWKEAFMYESNFNNAADPVVGSNPPFMFNVSFPESATQLTEKLIFVVSKGILQNSRIIIYAR